MKRASLALLLACAGALFLLGPSAADPKPPEPRPRGPVQLTEEALQIHRSALLVDGHNDLPWQFREKADLSFRKIDLNRPQKELHTDIPRLRQGGVGAQFWSAFVPADTARKKIPVRETLDQ